MKTSKRILMTAMVLALAGAAPARAQISVDAGGNGAITGGATGAGTSSGVDIGVGGALDTRAPAIPGAADITPPSAAVGADTRAAQDSYLDFTAIDRDRSGGLSRAELDGRAAADAGIFSRLDADGDGAVSSAETTAHNFTALDMDGNGRVNASEFRRAGPSAQAGTFTSLDADKDNSLSRAELSAWTAARGSVAR